MAEKMADHVLARLRKWDVEHVFGHPGDGINGSLAALSRRWPLARGQAVGPGPNGLRATRGATADPPGPRSVTRTAQRGAPAA